MLLTVHYGSTGVPAYDYWHETTILPAVHITLGLATATRRPLHPIALASRSWMRPGNRRKSHYGCGP
jgi:hypothetical protein